uniref:tRNA(Ile)-lysidine synthase n=1 Tax=Pterothamnion crispum TaxID=1550583 RepID=A0A4D6WZQ7_9FLOR|nr:tRNA Ile-lysidine synthetase [Pterothamnion crispum]
MNIHLNYKLRKNFYELIINNNISCILIAISGGQDSICLIQLIEKLSKDTAKQILIQFIYIDHQWKDSSKAQIQHIINYFKCYNKVIIIYQIKKLTYSETEARKIRYQIINHHAIKYNVSLIITGHTVTDKIETFLQKLLRGTSIDGATSLTYYRYLSKKIIIWRPLLNISRHEINWFYRHSCLPVWSDITNYYYNINRNRIRHELMPYFKNYFCVNIEHNINSFLNISYIDNEYIKQNTIKIYLLSRHKYNIAINYKIIISQHLAIQQRILQLFFYNNFHQSIEKKMLKKLLSLIYQSVNKYNKILWQNKKIYIYNIWLYVAI